MAARHDTEQLRGYLGSGGYATTREHEVFALCFDKGLSLSKCADYLGISFASVRYYLDELRRRARGQVTRYRARQSQARAA